MLSSSQPKLIREGEFMGASKTVAGLEDSIEYGQSGTRHVTVAHEALLDLIEIEPSLAFYGGMPNVVECLKVLGFRIGSHTTTKGNHKYTGFSTMPDHYVRCDHDKTMAFKTTLYGGTLRTDYDNKGIYNDAGIYTGTHEREKSHPELISVDSLNEYYPKSQGDVKDTGKHCNDIQHTLHLDIDNL